MNRFIPIGLSLLVILIALAIVFSRRNQTTDTTTSSPTPTTTVTTTTTDATVTPSSTPSPASAPAVHEVAFNGSTYSPRALTIKQGDTVKFTNQSNKAMWPASDNHPFHTKYSAFDPKSSVAAGQTFSFTFDKTGSWGFHDHLNSSITGTITVQ